jgi:hypothetical protein
MRNVTADRENVVLGLAVIVRPLKGRFGSIPAVRLWTSE